MVVALQLGAELDDGLLLVRDCFAVSQLLPDVHGG
jgi:hypothetical protein